MIRTLIAAAAALAASACHTSTETTDRDAGPEVDRAYQLAAFDRIEVAGPYEVKVTTGGDTKVTAKGGSALLDETDVKVEDGRLVIVPKKHQGIRWNWHDGKAVFAVSVASLKAAGIAGSGKIEVDKVAGDFDGDVAGSGDLKLGSVSGGTVKLAIAGSGAIRAAGKADAVDLSIAGSGDIDVADVGATSATVSIAGSGNVRANATQDAKVSIMGSGDVDIAGGAKCTVSKAGSGDVTCH